MIIGQNPLPYAIVGGNAAHLIKWRFDEECRKCLREIDIVKLFDSFKKEDMPLVYADLTKEVLMKILNISGE